MVTGTGGVGSTSQIDLNLSSVSARTTTDDFAQQLATAIEGYLGKVNSGSHFEIDVQSGSANDFTISVKDLGASSTTASASSATPAAMAAPAMTTPAAAAATAPADAPVDKSSMTPTDAYWAEQPAAVQALRDMPGDQRYAAAQDLAKQGYTIDVPIMVWGWDPLVTMTLRQNEGYTWVPSGLQPNIPIGPGIANVWNVPSYDPNNPPPGSIKVSTDFAIGTNMQDPWMNSLNGMNSLNAAGTTSS